ncbi:MAG: exo-alpha-sialidase [Nocardioidaceae bacterium]|nr:exo-alpha-sialidase [Nocardioidaceae bacterium]
MRFVREASLVAVTVLTAASLTHVAAEAVPTSDYAVTDDGAYTRHDGGTDQAIAHCGDPRSDPAADNVANDGDTDSNDGGNRRQGNEPTVAIDPTNPNVIVSGWNDYCQTDLAAGWMGLGFSTDRGATWSNSTLPGYPLDNSTEGSVSPLKGRTDSGDPLVAFDNDGRLFVGGIAFNRTKPQLGSVFVSTYGRRPGPAGVSGQLPKDYLRTRIVGKVGTPGVAGIFQDKPMLEVDRTEGPHSDNVYFCWTKFQGSGRNKIYFSRSTDHGRSFSRGVIVSDGFVQGCDIAVEGDGDVYVSWRTFAANGTGREDGMDVVRSDDGGATFDNKPTQIAKFTPYFPNVRGLRNCGDGLFFCGPEGYVFHRVPLEPRLTADQTGKLGGVFATWNAVDPASVEPRTTSYSSATPSTVGRSLVYVAKSTNNGRAWSPGVPVDRAMTDPGHQYFSDIDAYDGVLVAVWQDNRTDDAYSIQRPIGNMLDAQGRAVATGTDAVATYAATSTDGSTWQPLGQVSAATHQSQYEMFGSRDTPFQGDYNWVAIADGNGTAAPGGLFAYLTWTDNRQVEPGEDPRETEAEAGFVDGFDVEQCRVDLAGREGDVNRGVPLARADAPYTGDNCGNGGGLDQDIFGQRLTLN